MTARTTAELLQLAQEYAPAFRSKLSHHEQRLVERLVEALESPHTVQATVDAFLERVEMVRSGGQRGTVAKAFAVMCDDADDHEFKIAIPRETAKKLAAYLEEWDDHDQSPKIGITFSIPDAASEDE